MLISESQLKRLIRTLLREDADDKPGNADPKKQVYAFDFDDTLGLTKNANGIMLYKDGEPVHKSKEEVMKWLNDNGVNKSDLLPPEEGQESIQQIPEKDGAFMAYVTSGGLAKIQPNYTYKPTGKESELPKEGESMLVDFTPSSYTKSDTTDPISQTIDVLKKANAQGSDTIVITARQGTGTGTDVRGKTVTATNADDLNKFLADQGAAPKSGVIGVVGGNKGDTIKKKYFAGDDPPEEVHFFDDMTRNTNDVEALGGQLPAEIYVYGPGHFASDSEMKKAGVDPQGNPKIPSGHVDAKKPTKAFPPKKADKEKKEESKLSSSDPLVERWARIAGIK